MWCLQRRKTESLENRSGRVIITYLFITFEFNPMNVLSIQKMRFNSYWKIEIPSFTGIKIFWIQTDPIEKSSISEISDMWVYTLTQQLRKGKGNFLFRVHETSLQTYTLSHLIFLVTIYKILLCPFCRWDWGLRGWLFKVMKRIDGGHRIRHQVCMTPRYAAFRTISYLPCRWAADWKSTAPSHAFPVAY